MCVGGGGAVCVWGGGGAGGVGGGWGVVEDCHRVSKHLLYPCTNEGLFSCCKFLMYIHNVQCCTICTVRLYNDYVIVVCYFFRIIMKSACR